MSLSNTITLEKFKTTYCDTISIDKATNQKFIKIPVDDFSCIEYYNRALVQAIDIIALSQEHNPKNPNIGTSISSLCELLKAFTLKSEYEGLSRLV